MNRVRSAAFSIVSQSASSHATLGAAEYGAADNVLGETTRDKDDWNGKRSAAEVAIDGVGWFGVRVKGGRETTEAAGTVGSIGTGPPDVEVVRREKYRNGWFWLKKWPLNSDVIWQHCLGKEYVTFVPLATPYYK